MMRNKFFKAGLTKQAALKVPTAAYRVWKYKPVAKVRDFLAGSAMIYGATQIPAVQDMYAGIAHRMIDPVSEGIAQGIERAGNETGKALQKMNLQGAELASKTADGMRKSLHGLSDILSQGTQAIGKGIGSGLAVGARRFIGAAAGAGVGGLVTDILLDKYMKDKAVKRRRFLLTLLGSAAGGGLGYWASTLMDSIPHKPQQSSEPETKKTTDTEKK